VSFDTVRWDLVLKAVAHHIAPDQRWILLYVERWLKAPLQKADGTLVTRDRGTPQGPAGVGDLAVDRQPVHALCVRCLDGPGVSGVRFERYCDDVVVHCASEQQARQLRDALVG
jgi:RNA-directed DNA polymerase